MRGSDILGDDRIICHPVQGCSSALAVVAFFEAGSLAGWQVGTPARMDEQVRRGFVKRDSGSWNNAIQVGGPLS